MKRVRRKPELIETLRLLDAFARSRGLSLANPTEVHKIATELSQAAQEASANEVLAHGLRVEAMFAYVAGALGYCSAVKEEDSGELYAENNDPVPPDFRVVTQKGEEFFVEVKNCHKIALRHRFEIKSAYLARLQAYADFFRRPLRFAIYWSRARMWTLVSAEHFEPSGSQVSLTLEQCVKRSEMAVLGDGLVATVPPLELRILTDPAKPRQLGRDGKADFTIGATELWCGGKRIEDPFERKLAWFFMLFGEWEEESPQPEITNGELISIRYLSSKKPTGGEEFTMLGFLSRMISAQFNELTTSGGQVDRLIPSRDPGQLGVIVPRDYKGKILRLWRFIQSPNYK